jgi:hypothetical protein
MAVIEWEATARDVVVNVATPLAMVPVPMFVVPSLKVTVPDAVAGNTVAVNVTDAPNVEGFSEDVSVVPVGACVTVCDTAEEVLTRSLESPLYVAVKECEPTEAVEKVRVATPPPTAPEPMGVDPSLKLTAPVAVEGDTVAVRVTDCPKVEGFTDEIRTVDVGSAVIEKDWLTGIAAV